MIYRLTAIRTVNHILAVSAKCCNIAHTFTISEANSPQIPRGTHRYINIRKCEEWEGCLVSKRVVSVNARHMKRNDVDALNLPFQKTAKVRLLPMIPTMMNVPMLSAHMKSVSRWQVIINGWDIVNCRSSDYSDIV